MTPFNRFTRFWASFRSRIFLIFTGLTGIIFVAFVGILVTGEISSYKERSAEKAQLLASLLASSITLPLYSENSSELSRRAAEILNTPGVVHIKIKTNDNRMLIDSTSANLMTGHSLIESSVPVIATTVSPSAEAAISGVAASVTTTLGMVTVAIDTSDAKKSFYFAVAKTGGIAFLFWLAVVAACYPVLKQVTRSFNTLTDGLANMMGGNFSAKIIIKGDDEAATAATAINKLAEALEEREIENRNLQEELVKAVRLEAQEERRKIMAKLIQTNRMTSLGLLISSIAHNINTPNGAIKLAAQHLSGSWKDALPILEQVSKEEGDFTVGGLPFGVAKGEIRGAVDSILNNAGKVERVIQDLRTYNVGERSELSPGVMINRVVDEALTIIRAHGRQGEISISPNLTTNLPTITGNQYQLEQVVLAAIEPPSLLATCGCHIR